MDVAGFLGTAKGKKVLVIGDLMIDRYLWGKVERISPEAPVPIVAVQKEENRLGGAANVALNLQSLEAEVSLAGLIGNDEMGSVLRREMQNQGFSQDLILALSSRCTTVKTRVLGNHQQMIRVDKEDTFSPAQAEVDDWQEKLLKCIPEQAAIILQDYDKGCLFPALIQSVIQAAQLAKVPVLVDPKREHFFDYTGCTLFKPNLRELNEGLGVKLDNQDLGAIQAAIMSLRAQMPHQHTVVTLSEKGMIYVDPSGERHHIAAHARQISDVSGAGDTVISMLGLGFASMASPIDSVQIANLAGGLVCEEVGVVPIRAVRLLKSIKY
ncbi:MAG: PfkB family carbohydrate kinase [Bacteroidota bacterium]